MCLKESMKYNNILKTKCLFLIFAVLTGCTTSQISNFKMASEFVEIKKQSRNQYDNAKQVIAPISGIWTTKIQYGMMTIKLNLDGSGVLCETATLSEANHNSNQYPIKYLENHTLIAQNGLIFRINKIDSHILDTDFYWRNITRPSHSLLNSDHDLKQTSIACREKLK